MEQSIRYEALTVLGKRLVSELQLSDDVDTLGRWMAHYVAELIQDAERATGEDRAQKQAAARDAILAVWAHRAELPSGARPFAEFEPILRVLENLSPDSPSLRVVPVSHLPKDASQESVGTQDWLAMAQSLDRSAKLLITYCLRSAAQSSLEPANEWVKLATEAGVDDVLEVRLTRFLNREHGLMEGDDMHAQERGTLTDRRDKLGTFISLAGKVRDEIDERLREIPLGNKPAGK